MSTAEIACRPHTEMSFVEQR